MKLKCPNCGRSGKFNPATFLICNQCHSSLQLLYETPILTVTYPAKIQSQEIGELLMNYLSSTEFKDEVRIADVTPLYIPFWQAEGKDLLMRASSKFAFEGIKMPAEKRSYLELEKIDSLIEVAEIETIPAGIKEGTVTYIPLFKVKLSYRDRQFTFFVNAVNGEVYGEKIPLVSMERSLRLFPIFVSLFIVLLAIGFIFKPIFIAIPLSFIVLFLFSQLSFSVFSGGSAKK